MPNTPPSPTSLYADFQKSGRLVLRIKVIPKSAFSAIVGMLDDGTLKIRIAATPEKGKANAELLRFLAEDFGTTKDKITILSGSGDPVKLVRLEK